MKGHSLRVLEFDKIAAIVSGFAASEPGRAAARGMLPVADRSSVEFLLRETREFMHVLRNGEHPPFDGIFDIGSSLEKLGAAGGMLTAVELLQVASTLAAARRVKTFFQRFERSGYAVHAVSLCARAANIRPLKHVEDAVYAAIDERAEVKDAASPELRKIRRQIARTRDDILGRMSGILQDSGYQKVVQEPVITVRDDRYVLPLKPNFRQNLKGVVHGQSASRATLFVEPMEVLEQNNRLAELRLQERDEVERILRALTALAAQERGAIEAAFDALAAIDAIAARARFGIEVGGEVPELSPGKRFRLRTAKHPLLVWKRKHSGGPEVTPNTLELNDDDRTLILSGPNAGGKTVILKTVGLFALMTQAGLPVTAAEGSELPCFASIFADIGDEQSIEQDLSTFSSHVGNIAEILREAREDSLVLLDELGAGTDPGEGAGLGAAVLDSLLDRRCLTLVTTHHNTLKLFAAETRGAVNASMEFDSETLKPTYRLIPGRPGRSYGLDMAARIGVARDVIEKAKARISADDTRLENLLKQVEADAARLSSEREALERDQAVARHNRSEAAAALQAARDEARTIRETARRESRDVVAELRRKLRELSRAASLGKAEIQGRAAEVSVLTAKLDTVTSERTSGPVPELHPGDRVRIPRWNRPATVLAAQRGMLELEIEGKKLKLPAHEALPIEPLPAAQRGFSVPGWSADVGGREESPDRLNIIGYRVEQGIAEVERFIDHAGMTGLSTVTIIHGLGTGALKKAVTEYLKNQPLVAAIRAGEPAEGGAGVTVAELKK